jgi:flagellar basal-body rod protein FlgG
LPLKGSISVPREATALLVAEGGQVLALVAGQKGPQSIGQIELTTVSDPRALTALGDGLYRIEDPLADLSRGMPGDGSLGLVAQGYLESSNVKMVDEMVSMMLMQRAYSANARVIQLADEMMNTINQLRR